MVGDCHAFLSAHCSLVVTCWERVHFLTLLYVMLYYVFVTFPCGNLGQVWYFNLIDFLNFLLSYFAYGNRVMPIFLCIILTQ